MNDTRWMLSGVALALGSASLLAAAGGLRGSRATMEAVPESPFWTAAFKQWFGLSQVVDDRGQPLRVYRGLGNPSHPGREDGVRYWTDRLDVAESYSGGGPRAVVQTGWLHILNPYILETEADAHRLAEWLGTSWDGSSNDLWDLSDHPRAPCILRGRGYDGIRLLDCFEGEHTTWIPLRSGSLWAGETLPYRRDA